MAWGGVGWDGVGWGGVGWGGGCAMITWYLKRFSRPQRHQIAELHFDMLRTALKN